MKTIICIIDSFDGCGDYPMTATATRCYASHVTTLTLKASAADGMVDITARREFHHGKTVILSATETEQLADLWENDLVDIINQLSEAAEEWDNYCKEWERQAEEFENSYEYHGLEHYYGTPARI